MILPPISDLQSRFHLGIGAPMQRLLIELAGCRKVIGLLEIEWTRRLVPHKGRFDLAMSQASLTEGFCANPLRTPFHGEKGEPSRRPRSERQFGDAPEVQSGLHILCLVAAVARDGHPGLRAGSPAGTEVVSGHIFCKPF